MEEILKDVYLDPDLIEVKLKAKNWDEVLQKMGELFFKKKIVKASFIPAVISREKIFSTGLQCNDIGVAIPHTDSEHVNTQSIAIAVLEEPVIFKQMGDSEINVRVNIVFMLAIKEPHKQLDFLQALMTVFQDQGKLKSLLDCNKAEDVVKRFISFFKIDQGKEAD